MPIDGVVIVDAGEITLVPKHTQMSTRQRASRWRCVGLQRPFERTRKRCVVPRIRDEDIELEGSFHHGGADADGSVMIAPINLLLCDINAAQRVSRIGAPTISRSISDVPQLPARTTAASCS